MLVCLMSADRDMKLISNAIGAGAKGKFSGGFDISAFAGLQKGPSMIAVFLCLIA